MQNGFAGQKATEIVPVDREAGTEHTERFADEWLKQGKQQGFIFFFPFW